MARLTAMLSVCGAAVAIATAPAALAQPDCEPTSGDSVCQSPGDTRSESPGDHQIGAEWPGVAPPGYWGGGTDGFEIR